MSKKHSKFRNVGLIFEFLIQAITSDLMSGIEKPLAIPIIKEHLNEKTELYKELELYKSLINNTLSTPEKAKQLIDETCRQRKLLNQEKLRKEKHALIGKINECYGDSIYNSRVPNYKLLASIHKLFEHNLGKIIPPIEVINSKETISEHILRNKKVEYNAGDKFVRLDEELQVLSYNLLIDKFNEKYKTLTSRQKKLLKEYINNTTNNIKLKQYIDSELEYVKKRLSNYIPKIDEDITKIKITELKNNINNIFKGKVASDNHVSTLMGYYQLIIELKKELGL